jgi:hypothetical protein
VAEQVGITEQASRQAYVRAKRSLMEILSPKLLQDGLEGGAHELAPVS